jgi:hypothetical protein
LFRTTITFLPQARDRLEKGPLAFGERAIGGGDEEHQVGAGDEFPGQGLVLPQHRVGARGVHDHQVAQDLGGGGEALEPGRGHLAPHRLAVTEKPDAGGGGGDPFFQSLLAE